MSLRERIISILTKELTPIYLQVKDFSESHKGHDGYGEAGESHFDILIVSQVFSGKNRVERHKMVYNFLKHEFSTTLHALTIKALTEEEAHKSKDV
jgi:stress-induced morphogen